MRVAADDALYAAAQVFHRHGDSLALRDYEYLCHPTFAGNWSYDALVEAGGQYHMRMPALGPKMLRDTTRLFAEWDHYYDTGRLLLEAS